MLLTFFVMLSILSCNKSELFEAPVADVIIDNPADTPAEDTTPIVNSTEPCDFTLDAVQSGDTVIINCLMDLGGQTINLPSNVTIVYEGGDIINGTLVFTGASVISGELLNSSLTLGGSSPQLKDPTFNFDPQRWGIVEGKVSQEVAQRNSEIINDIILKTKGLGINTFSIDKLDAYFYQVNNYSYVFNLPSDFHLIMSDNTHLRVFPNNDELKGNLIRIQDKENVTVTGGFLHGDRDEHDYSSGGTHEQGHLIVIKTGVNVKIENVHMSYAIGDGLDVESYRLRNDPLFERGSSNVLITGCTFDSNRRNNLSITDGEDIIVENCTFLNAGIATSNSTGTAPRAAIDIEPDIYDYSNPRQLVNRVIIRNNKESGPHGGLIVFSGNDVLVTGNIFENNLSVSRAFNVKFSNNTARSISAGILEISDPRNYEVSGNTVSNPDGTGIFAANPGVQIFDNNINNCKSGIQLRNVHDADIYNNVIKGNEDGITGFNVGDNTVINNNIINVDRPFFFQGGNSYTISNNTVNSSSFGYFQLSDNFKITNNDFTNKGIRLEGSTNAIIQSNNFTFNDGTVINIRGNSNNTKILNNVFESTLPSGYGIYGEGNGENSNLVINDNEFKNVGIYSRNYDGFTVKNNKGYINNSNLGYINFVGNNSFFENNKGFNGEVLNHQIQGSNNTIIK